MSPTLAADGSSKADRVPTVEIDLDDVIDRWRYTCPRGDRNWEPTNGGIWCQSCSRAHDVDDPHYHELLDQVTDEKIPWSAVEITDPESESESE